MVGARCDSSSACDGDRWLGGWSSDGAILEEDVGFSIDSTGQFRIV